MKIYTYLITAVTGFFVLAGSPVRAQTITYNFDDDVNPFSAGTISTSQAQSGPKSLQFTGEEFATWNLPAAYLNKSIQVTMSVFDEGRWRADGGSGNPGNGPRWGVGHDTTTGDYAAVTIAHKSYLESDSAYGRDNADAPFLGLFSRNEWFGVAYMGSRGSAHLSPTPNDGSTGTGTWTTWTFDVDHITGDVNYTGTGSPVRNRNIGQSASALYLFGGDTNEGTLAGMYVDDITVTVTAVPEPGTLALLGIAAGCLGLTIMHRHRRS